MDLASIIPTALSLGAAASSAYLWVAQSRREAPRLQLHFGRRRPRQVGLSGTADPNSLDCHYEVELVVTNLSTMPDVLTGLRLKVRGREAGWVPTRLTRDPYQQADPYARFPISLAPRTSAVLLLRLGFVVPRGIQPADYLTSPLQIEGSVLGLGGREHRAQAAQSVTPS